MRKAELFGVAGAIIMFGISMVFPSFGFGILIAVLCGFFGFFLVGYAMYGDEEIAGKSF